MTWLAWKYLIPLYKYTWNIEHGVTSTRKKNHHPAPRIITIVGSTSQLQYLFFPSSKIARIHPPTPSYTHTYRHINKQYVFNTSAFRIDDLLLFTYTHILVFTMECPIGINSVEWIFFKLSLFLLQNRYLFCLNSLHCKCYMYINRNPHCMYT